MAHIISVLTLTNIAYGFDTPINCVCIVLMSKYYSKSYERLCCLVIKCVDYCDKRKKTESEMSNNIHTESHNDDKEKEKGKNEESIFDTRTLQIAMSSIEGNTDLEETQSVL